MLRCCSLAAIAAMLLVPAAAEANELPRVRVENGASQLIVHGKPYVILGGELGNSSAGTAAQADDILPRLARMYFNTVLMPVAWEQIEPVEGQFDFSILDHWIDVAKQNKVHLVLLWFGSWKNGFSSYAPTWVKADAKRFPRAISADGEPLEILSTFGVETLKSDCVAFGKLMAHVREHDAEDQTVLMVQVENEVGYLGRGRDRSTEADKQFKESVPHKLITGLNARRLSLSPELAAHFVPEGHTWSEVFGDAANEIFMAWRYASYIEKVAAAGKAEYALPMYVNAQLPAVMERAGEYPSGGPHPYYLEVYRVTAPSIDMYCPDIYWPEFEYWVKRYQIPSNPIFVPEARLETGPYNALYAFGVARALGFSPFDVDRLKLPESGKDANPLLMDVYASLNELGDVLPEAQAKGLTTGVVLHADGPRASQTVALGGYLFESSLSRSWPTNALAAKDGAMLLLQTGANEFLALGCGLAVKIRRDPDVDTKIAGIASVEQVSKRGNSWAVEQRLNGDQTNQGRQLSMDPREMHIYRIVLYTADRAAESK
jgi:hypothetical protein